MLGPSISLGASSCSQSAPSRKRSGTDADLDIDAQYEKAEKARKSGKKAYWQCVHTVKSDAGVFYQCKFCHKHLSVKNPHDSVAKHVVVDEGDSFTCKVQLPLERQLSSARERAAGATQWNLMRLPSDVAT
jgi:hypothetical protein